MSIPRMTTTILIMTRRLTISAYKYIIIASFITCFYLLLNLHIIGLTNHITVISILADRDCQAPDTRRSLPPRAPESAIQYPVNDRCFSVFTPPARLTTYFRTSSEGREVARRMAIGINFDYYSPANCPDTISDDDSDSTDDDLDYQNAKLGFF